ncbi:hypothetical protein GEU84_009230 [Fertoebacter nigrum]|uniref:DUF6473 domain-containing protein n=1 Tax=Fertoeibacter niger TaxID=2656921 RepID=A0A8X8GWT7_9RHOB|nr:DUF6473 family protein [Fertoeibacter niger]NUB44562.1 hypothetical protein [Fertoeibacter niger]
MAFAYPGDGALDYLPCRYGTSKLLFRGPRAALDGEYCAVLGGTETYGKFVPQPYPALVAQATGLSVANLGCMNAGPDVYLNDPAALEVAARARVTVVQIMGAQNMTNRFYSVHPRRNDRFLRATPLLRSLYRDVEFTEFHFTRHLLHTLQAVSADRFELLAAELRAVWVTRMLALLKQLRGHSLLLWMADHPPPGPARADLACLPMLVDAAMIAAVRPHATDYLEVVSSPEARAQGVNGMGFAPLDRPAAAEVPGPAAHAEVASALAARMRRLM